MRRAAVLLLALSLDLLGAACSPPGAPAATASPSALPTPAVAARYQAEPAAHEGGTVTVGDWVFPQALTPPYPQPAAATMIENALFDGLVGYDPQVEPYPDLATAVPTVENGGVRMAGSGMDVTYTLRSGLRWSDGQPITADDVIFTWKVEAAVEGYDLVTGIDHAGESGLVVHFRSVYPSYLLLFGAVLPAHRLGTVDLRQLPSDGYWQKPDVVSGPFMVADAAPGDHYTLQRNPHYTDGRAGQAVLGHAAHLDRLVFKAFPTKSSLLAAVKAGDIQVALELGERDVPVAASLGDARLQLVPMLSYEQLSLNREDPLFAGDAALAQALMLGVDRKAVLTSVLKGIAPAADSPFSPQLTWLPSAPPLQLDAAAAAAKLDLDGWTAGADGVRQRSGHRLQVTLATTAGNPQREAEVEAIAAGWRRLGVDVRVQNAPADRLFASYDGNGILARGAYQAAVWAWVEPADPDSLYATLSSARVPGPGKASAYQDYSRCRDPEIDAALGDARATLDRAARTKAYQRFLAAYQAARCETPLYQRLDVGLSGRKLHNFAPNPTTTGNTWNVADWWLG